MGHLIPSFAEEFRLATDDEVLAVDFWSYLNARQARLAPHAGTNPLWDCLEELELDLEPLLDGRTPLTHRQYLTGASRRWAADHGGDPLRAEVRHEAAAMLADALARTDAATATLGRNHAQRS